MAICVAISERSAFAELRMARIDFFLGRSNQLIEQIVRFDSESLAAADPDVGAGLVFFGQFVAQFGGATRREHDHLVGEMRVVARCLPVPQVRAALRSRCSAPRTGGHR